MTTRDARLAVHPSPARGGIRPNRADIAMTSGASSTSWRIAARALLGAHATAIFFATAALVTILAGPPPAFLQEEPAASVYRIAWSVSGPAVIVLGAAGVFAHAVAVVGARRALAALLLTVSVSLGAELLGTTTGLPFGPYEYTGLLGYRVLGHVPLAIPLSWFFMIYACAAMAVTLTPRIGSTGIATRSRIGAVARPALVAGLLLTAWDVSLEPAMSAATSHWFWKTPGFYYGMPLLNWFGWLLTGTVVATVLFVAVPPELVRQRVAPSRVPTFVYLVNGIMPCALCARHGMWAGAILGAIVMAVPAVLAFRRRR